MKNIRLWDSTVTKSATVMNFRLRWKTFSYWWFVLWNFAQKSITNL